MPRASLLSRLLAAVIPLVAASSVHAQWITQTNQLKAGWNAVYLFVDSSYATLDELIAVDPNIPIEEVWLWQPAPGTAQFVTSPDTPTTGTTQWQSWSRATGTSSGLRRLPGNAACLVRVRNANPTYTWLVKGHPVAPRYRWTSSGLNFIGFPTPDINPPSYETFLSRQPELLQNAEIYRYPGGEFGAGNPARLFALRTTPLTRGEGMWIRSGRYFNRYFGPLELDLQAGDGPAFGDRVGQYRIRVRNIVSFPVTVSFSLLPSESRPAGQTDIAGSPPVLVRGALNPTNLTYGFSVLNGTPQSFNLAGVGQPESERDIVIGIDRSQMPGPAGTLFAGVLRITDSLNLSQLDLPVSATVASKSGLWVGEAKVTHVRHYLKSFARDSAGKPVAGSDGRYTAVSTDSSLGTVSRNFRLRLILHNNEQTAVASLLQRAYYGVGKGGNLIVATREDLLDTSELASARRVSAVHLPRSDANTPWSFTGTLALGSTISATVPLNYADPASNPFVHEYHPDHDNLNTAFSQQEPQGAESWGVNRDVRLTFGAPPGDFNSLTTGGLNLSGEYEEVVTFLGRGAESREFNVRGIFSLGRVSEIALLSQ